MYTYTCERLTKTEKGRQLVRNNSRYKYDVHQGTLEIVSKLWDLLHGKRLSSPIFKLNGWRLLAANRKISDGGIKRLIFVGVDIRTDDPQGPEILSILQDLQNKKEELHHAWLEAREQLLRQPVSEPGKQVYKFVIYLDNVPVQTRYIHVNSKNALDDKHIKLMIEHIQNISRIES